MTVPLDPRPAPVVPCPQCRRPVQWTLTNAYRPFCSERCKLIDLGQWANEGYRIPTQDRPDGNEANVD